MTDGDAGLAGYPDVSPHRIARPFSTQAWEAVTMLHWRVDAAEVAARIPAPLRPDTFDGSAWISLVPFRMAQLTLTPVPALPIVGTFPETNVRTYVTGPDGPAVWFFSLDVPRFYMVPAARAFAGQPYSWSRMAISRRGTEIRYASTGRRLPGPRWATSQVGVRIGPPTQPDDLDRWLVNRWAAYGVIAGRLCHTPVVHTPWPLQEAELTRCADRLGEAAGFAMGDVERVRYAALAADVGFGPPRRVGRG